jgi:hypothetical protein
MLRFGKQCIRLGFKAVGSLFLLSPLPHFLEVDVTAPYIRVGQLHSEPLPDIHALETAYQSAFHGRLQQTDPRAFVGCAGDESIETFPDP